MTKNLSLAYRGTRYQNEFTEGNLHSLNISMAMVRWARLVLTGGVRDEAGDRDAEAPGGAGGGFAGSFRWTRALPGYP